MFLPLLHEVIGGEIDIYQGSDGVLTTSVALSQSADGARIVTVDCSLAPIGDDERTWEFSFAISCTAIDYSELPFSTQDREIAASYIPLACRRFVMPSVCYVAQALVRTREPPQVYRVEKLVHLPAKAARKHELVTTALEVVGYTIVESGLDRFGRRYRVMARAIEEVL